MCAEALVAGANEALVSQLASIAKRNSSARRVVLTLSRGTPASEEELPQLTPGDLIAPSGWAFESDSDHEPVPEDVLRDILMFNEHALSLVNPNNAPVTMDNDPDRSGLFLLPAFLNHSCRPNVQRLMANDRLFLRAARDMEQGEELFDNYCELLRPLSHRRTALKAFGFCCNCERCTLEEAVLGEDATEVICLGVEAAQRSDNETQRNDLEACVQRAEALVGQRLDGYLRSQVELPTGLPQAPAEPIPAARAAQLRWGLEAFADIEEETAFRAQERLHSLLMCSMAGLLRQQATCLKGDSSCLSDQAAAWSRLFDVTDEVMACSEFRAAASSELLYVKLLMFRLDFRNACRAELRHSLLAHHEAFGGGSESWCALNKHMFTKELISCAKEVWSELSAEFGFKEVPPLADIAPATAPALSPAPVPGQLSTKTPAPAPEPPATPLPPPPSAHALAPLAPLLAPAPPPTLAPASAPTTAPTPVQTLTTNGVAVQSGSAAAGEPSATCEDLGDEVIVRAVLPGVESASQTTLEVGNAELRLWRILPGNPSEPLLVSLPREVDPSSSVARWSKRTQRLTIRLRTQ